MISRSETHPGESGQAFVELVAILIPIIFIFTGMIVAAVLGYRNLACSIEARSELEMGLANGNLFSKVQPEYLPGGMAAYPPDHALDTGGEDSLMIYTDADNWKNNYRIKALTSEDLRDAGYLSMDFGKINFLDAANLRGEEKSDPDPLKSAGLEEMRDALRIYLKKNITLSDKAFLPSLSN